MKFLIHRTSDYFGDKQPCKDAFRDKKYDYCQIKRWAVDIKIPEDLEKLYNEVNYTDIVITFSYLDTGKSIGEIEIWDSHKYDN